MKLSIIVPIYGVEQYLHKCVDSLLALISPNTPDSLKAKYYSNIGELSDCPDTVIKYSQLSLDLCQESELWLHATNYDCIGWAYYLKDEARMSLSFSLKALAVLQKINNKQRIAEECISIAKCYHELNISDSIFYYFNKALDIYVALQDSDYMAYTYRSIGMVNSDMEFYKTAAEYLENALVIDSMLGNQLDMADDYLYLALAFHNNQPKSLEYLRNQSFCSIQFRLTILTL